VNARFPLPDGLLRQYCAEQRVLDTVSASLQGLSCRVDPALIVRSLRPGWSTWGRVRVLWISVNTDRDVVRVACGLLPEDLVAIHQEQHRNTAATFSRGWARRPLVEAAIRCVIAALCSENLPDGNPLAARRQAVPQWARALALHYLGLRELRADAVARCMERDACNDAAAGVHATGLPQDIGPLLKSLDYLYDCNDCRTLERIPEISFPLFCAIAIAFACGAIEGRSPASDSQIQRLKRQLPPEFDIKSVATLPQLSPNGRIVTRLARSTENPVSIRTPPKARSGRGAERVLSRSL
jgi:hypothetical protein